MERTSKRLSASVVLVFCLGSSPAIEAQAFECEPSLTAKASAEGGYGLRGNRCEGTFEQDVGGDILQIVSFINSRSIGSGELILRWRAPDDAPVSVRAVSTDPKIHYQMDTLDIEGDGEFRWETKEVLDKAGFSREDHLGIRAWSETDLTEDGKLLLPIAVTSLAESGPPPESTPGLSGYWVTLLPGVGLKNVSYSLHHLDEEGFVATTVVEDKPLPRQDYAPLQQILFKIPPLESSGTYMIEIGAFLDEDEPYAPDPLLFYVAPELG